MEVCLAALQALQSTSASLNLLEYKITPYLQKKGIMEPVAPDTPQLLPHVHVFWGPLLAALKVDLLINIGRSLLSDDMQVDEDYNLLDHRQQSEG